MKILDLILNRRTIHSYRREAIPAALIENALLAAVHAPNHKLTWPWRFFVLGEQSRSALCRIANSDKFMNCGAMLALAIVRTTDEFVHRENYAALACAVQNMSLYLHSEGIGTKWSTGKVTRADEMYKMLNITPEEYELCGLFWIGYAEETPPPVTRPALNHFIKYLS